jgi:ribA/ribD-fused uncharacterized protein
MRTTDTHVYFWGSFLSNWIPSDLSIEAFGEIFTNSEQLYMWLKAMHFRDKETAKRIVEEGTSPRVAKDLGRLVKNYDDKEWDKIREGQMYIAVKAKFESSELLKEKLLNTGDRILVEGTPFDPVWGVMIKWDDDRILDEKNWKGQNLLGKVLMKVREELK